MSSFGIVLSTMQTLLISSSWRFRKILVAHLRFLFVLYLTPLLYSTLLSDDFDWSDDDDLEEAARFEEAKAKEMRMGRLSLWK